MKHQDKIEKFLYFLEGQNVSIHSKQIKQLDVYFELIYKWSERINLVSKNDISFLTERHFMPSAWMSFYIRKKNATVMDIGSGAGFPGIVTSILKENAQIILVESVKKKCLFLSEVIEEIGLKSKLMCDRIENIQGLYKNNFDYVLCRSVGPVKKIWKWAEPLLKNKGKLIMLKGNDEEDVIEIIRENQLIYSIYEPDIYGTYKNSTLKSKIIMILEKNDGKQ